VKLTFLGTSGAVPVAGESNVSFAVSHGEGVVLVEASGTPAADFGRAGLELLRLEAVVISHAHPDHVYGFPALLQSLRLLGRNEPLVVAANPPTLGVLRRLARLLRLYPRAGVFPVRWTALNDGELTLESGLQVRMFPVRHSRPTCGLHLSAPESCLAYSADTAPCPRLVDEARGCTALIHEASCGAADEEAKNPLGHSSGRQAGLAAAQAGVGTLFLCHFDYQGGATPQAMEAEARTAFEGTVAVPRLYHPYPL
jgi:ribonuclease Z